MMLWYYHTIEWISMVVDFLQVKCPNSRKFKNFGEKCPYVPLLSTNVKMLAHFFELVYNGYC